MNPPVALPTGTVTFLFTDIEGSTARWDHDEAAMAGAQRRHDAILEEVVLGCAGTVFKTVGDEFCAVFHRPQDALDAAIHIQRRLLGENWDDVGGLRVRAAIHTDTPADEREHDYFGRALSVVARLLGLGHGGQILVSAAAAALLEPRLPPGARLSDLGTYQLRGIAHPERVHQVVAPDLPADFPPLHSPPPAPISNLTQSHPRNPAFTGRYDALAALEAALATDRAAAVTQAITGLGGIGKTQLALEFAYRHTEDVPDYDLAWWLHAEEPTTLAAEFAGLAAILGVQVDAGAGQPALIEAVHGALADRRRWLLIFDDAASFDSVRPYLPSRATGHVLVTSRDQTSWRPFASPLPLDPLSPEYAVHLLLFRSGRPDDGAAGQVAAELGYLPLALDQAASYVEQTAMPFASYLAFLRQHARDALSRGRPVDYPGTVATTWHLSFDAVSNANPAAADLLTLCAFLAPDAIPLSLLPGGAGHLSEPLARTVRDPALLNDAIADLRRFSLVERIGDYLSVHRIVQAVTRDSLEPLARTTWATAALQVVNEAFPADSGESHTWQACGLLLPHALWVSEHAAASGVVNDTAGRLLNQVGVFLSARAAFAPVGASCQVGRVPG